jgi:F420H(2)-dependent quinone reductase
MSRVRRPALRGSVLGGVLRAWNPIMRALLGSPLHWPLSRWFAVLSWSGRRSGRRYTTPVSYVRDGRTVWLTTGDQWWRNLVEAAPVAIRIRGRWHDGRGLAITDRVESRQGHDRLFRRHAWFRVLAGIPRGRGGPDPEALDRALAAGRVLVRIDLSP